MTTQMFWLFLAIPNFHYMVWPCKGRHVYLDHILCHPKFATQDLRDRQPSVR